MNSISWVRTRAGVRVGTLVFPPLGLVLLWASPAYGVFRKIFGTLYVALYALVHAALIIWLLVRFTGMTVEWPGGYLPRFTYSPTVPDFDALEAHRAQHRKPPERAADINAAGAHPRPYWTDFRGPQRDGRYDERPILTNWPAAGLRQLWKQPVGGGYASFVVAQGLAFTLEQRRAREVVVAYDLETGREVWTHGWEALFQEAMGGDGPRATPTWHEGRLYALGADGDFRCLEAATGKLIWAKNILSDNGASNLYYAQSASPLIVEEKVIVQPGGAAGRSVVAYHKVTGETVWKSHGDEATYSSPMLVELAGRRQLLLVGPARAFGLAVEDGKFLWSHPWVVLQGNRNIAQPVLLATNRFLLSGGYGTGCEAVEVSRPDAGFAARQLWKNKLLKNKFSSSVFWQGHIYGLDEDILTCLDAATGERKWKDGRHGHGQLLLASGHLVILGGDGALSLVKATPDHHEELARFSAIRGKTWNHPALAHGRILVRNSAEMACFEISPP